MNTIGTFSRLLSPEEPAEEDEDDAENADDEVTGIPKLPVMTIVDESASLVAAELSFKLLSFLAPKEDDDSDSLLITNESRPRSIRCDLTGNVDSTFFPGATEVSSASSSFFIGFETPPALLLSLSTPMVMRALR
jgi:hypothetical protein